MRSCDQASGPIRRVGLISHKSGCISTDCHRLSFLHAILSVPSSCLPLCSPPSAITTSLLWKSWFFLFTYTSAVARLSRPTGNKCCPQFAGASGSRTISNSYTFFSQSLFESHRRGVGTGRGPSQAVAGPACDLSDTPLGRGEMTLVTALLEPSS